jgi:8-oxo-dGTP pyrophosphatase MutT (NUDIX family)
VEVDKNVQQYAVGFMFTSDMSRVALIKKNHGPKCVIGRWNGIGGHLEDDDASPVACQVREFEEETGVKTDESQWQKFTDLVGDDFHVHCFWAISDHAALNVRTITDEVIGVLPTDPHQILKFDLAPNVSWWIPFLCDTSTKNHLCVVLATYVKDDDLG